MIWNIWRSLWKRVGLEVLGVKDQFSFAVKLTLGQACIFLQPLLGLAHFLFEEKITCASKFATSTNVMGLY